MKHFKLLNQFVLVILVLYLTNCGKEPVGPCPEEKRTLEIDGAPNWDDDSFFAYNGTQQRLTYLYSNDSIKGDTMHFDLVKIDTITYTVRAWMDGGNECEAFAEVYKKYYYVSSNGLIYKNLRVSFDTDSHFYFELKDSNEAFDNSATRQFDIYSGAYTTKIDDGAEIISSYKVLGKTFHHVIIGIGDDRLCPDDSTFYAYNTKFGFLELYKGCSNEKFQLIVN